FFGGWCWLAGMGARLGVFVVDSACALKAEVVVWRVGEALGSLPVRRLSVKVAPTATPTDWVKTQDAARDFPVLDEWELRDTHEEGAVVR
ncbi:recombination-associated protein RdgC, partial [Pseudomonas aeruginosa]|uniref:recombination-associated protein RdgC n=1 Tax=Pseudomonas aeruginosa TaxID=287 RepID=UPI003CC52B6A